MPGEHKICPPFLRPFYFEYSYIKSQLRLYLKLIPKGKKAESLPNNSVLLSVESLELLSICAILKKKIISRARFWSSDLWVMGPARFHCATLLLMDKSQANTRFVRLSRVSFTFEPRTCASVEKISFCRLCYETRKQKGNKRELLR